MARNVITPEQIEDNFEFKIVKKLLKQKFPWITDVKIDVPALDEYRTIFLDIYVDTKKFMEETETTLEKFTKNSFDITGNFKAGFLNVPFKELSYEEARDIEDELKHVMNSVRKSPAMPYEMKLPVERSFGVSTFILSPVEDSNQNN